MTREPAYLNNKEIPDEQLLIKIKEMVKDGKSPNKIKNEMSDISLYIIRRYYTKIKKGLW
jgi:hypothetical protein